MASSIRPLASSSQIHTCFSNIGRESNPDDDDDETGFSNRLRRVTPSTTPHSSLRTYRDSRLECVYSTYSSDTKQMVIDTPSNAHSQGRTRRTAQFYNTFLNARLDPVDAWLCAFARPIPTYSALFVVSVQVEVKNSRPAFRIEPRAHRTLQSSTDRGLAGSPPSWDSPCQGCTSSARRTQLRGDRQQLVRVQRDVALNGPVSAGSAVGSPQASSRLREVKAVAADCRFFTGDRRYKTRYRLRTFHVSPSYSATAENVEVSVETVCPS